MIYRGEKSGAAPYLLHHDAAELFRPHVAVLVADGAVASDGVEVRVRHVDPWGDVLSGGLKQNQACGHENRASDLRSGLDADLACLPGTAGRVVAKMNKDGDCTGRIRALQRE